MSLPLSFLAGLLFLAAQGWLDSRLPEDPALLRLVLFAPLLLVPGLAARFLLPRSLPPRAGLLRACGALVPLGSLAFAQATDLQHLAPRIAGDSLSLGLLAMLGPLLVAEVGLRVGEQLAIANPRFPKPALGYLPQLGIERLPMVAFLVTPVFLCAVVSDLALRRRHWEAFFQHTALGMTIAALLLVAVLAILMPLLLRVCLPVHRLGSDVASEAARAAASELDFPEGALCMLETGHREVNAALVGPLPWPRYLVLSDGLLSLFRRDLRSLRGVIAHEVGHARGRHPAWLVLCVAVLPLLWLEPVSSLLPKEPWAWWVWAAVTVATILVLLGLRALAHRFEHEADQLASEVLGDARACVEALRRVGELFPSRSPERASLRHPSEEARVALLLEHERDPGALEKFWRRGRLLRSTLAGSLLISLALSAHAHAKTWSIDRIRAAYAEGRFPAAAGMLSDLDEQTLADAKRRSVHDLKAELAAAREIFPEGGEWLAIRDRLAGAGSEHAVAILAKSRDRAATDAARPWLGLASLVPAPSALVRTLSDYCDAVRDGREQEARSLWAHAESLSGRGPR